MRHIQNPAYRGSVSFFHSTAMKTIFNKIIRYFSDDIWKLKKDDVPAPLFFLINILKTLMLAVRAFVDARIMRRAAALSFSTMLAIVPVAAVVFGIARGFGFSKYIEEWFTNLLSSQPQAAEIIIGFVNSYLVHVKNGVILGIGVVVMLYTAIMLISNIEGTFNDIWNVRNSRGWTSTIIDYVAFIVLLPFAIILTSGINILMSAVNNQISEYAAPMVRCMVSVTPCVVMSLLFIIVYKVMPNTKVNFSSVIWPGILAGVAMQILQVAYINLQLWATSYNAIYGSFAALPLFMLWMQFSWIICLFGVHLCYTNQNMERLMPVSYNEEISHEHKVRLCALLLSFICHRFEKGEAPYTPLQLRSETDIPTHIIIDMLDRLEKAGLIIDTSGGSREVERAYMPTIDVSNLTVGLMVEKLENGGNWSIDEVGLDALSKSQWLRIRQIRGDYLQNLAEVRVADLEIE